MAVELRRLSLTEHLVAAVGSGVAEEAEEEEEEADHLPALASGS